MLVPILSSWQHCKDSLVYLIVHTSSSASFNSSNKKQRRIKWQSCQLKYKRQNSYTDSQLFKFGWKKGANFGTFCSDFRLRFFSFFNLMSDGWHGRLRLTRGRVKHLFVSLGWNIGGWSCWPRWDGTF